MQLTATHNPTTPPALDPTVAHLLDDAARPGVPGFAESLASALKRDEDDITAPGADEQRAREAAEQLVATAFILPMLNQLRNGPFKADFLEAGPGRDAFEQQLHTHLADAMVQRMDLPIVDAVTRFVMQHSQAPATSGTKVDRHG